MGWLCRVLDARYLYSTGRPWPGPWAIAGMVLVTLVSILLAARVVWAWRRGMEPRQQGRPPIVPAVAMACSLLGLAVFLLGPYLPGPLSARVVYLSLIAMGLLAPLFSTALRPRWPGVLHPPLRALACELRPHDPSWPWHWQLLWLAAQGWGLHALIVYEGLSWTLAAAAIVCLLAASAAQWRAREEIGPHLLRTEVLAPLLLPLAAYLARWLGRSLCRIQLDEYVGYPYADLLSPWSDQQAMLYAGIVLMILTTAALCWRAWVVPWLGARDGDPGALGRTKARLGQAMGIALLVVGLAWYGAMVARHLSHGATGSDPYCYLQMAVDLAERGTALHRFPLAELGHRASLPLWPLVPVGYHPPRPDGWAATVWPIGWPLLLAPFYRLGGERALLGAAPAMTAAAALLAWACARLLWPAQSTLAGGLAAWLILTSREAVWRSLVPMADGAAMALAMLALVALLQAQRRDALRWSAVAGAVMGMAYLVRHPLLPLFLAALPLLLDRRRPLQRRALHGLAIGIAALPVVLLDLRYHVVALGSPWTPESPETDLLSWRYVEAGLAAFLDQGILSRHEFGFVLPLVLYGAWLQIRRPEERPQALAMVLGVGGVLLFGLSYRALRLRDLLALFPWLALWAGRGLAGWWALAARPGVSRLKRRALLLTLLWVALFARSAWTLQRLHDPRIATFGHLSASQRHAYDQLAALVPENAVLACGLGAGSMAYYTGREIVRPASWSGAEFRRFVDLLAEDNRPLYVVQDGTEMVDWLARARGEGHSFVSQSTLNLPTFAAGGEPSRPGSTIYRFQPSD